MRQTQGAERIGTTLTLQQVKDGHNGRQIAIVPGTGKGPPEGT